MGDNAQLFAFHQIPVAEAAGPEHVSVLPRLQWWWAWLYSLSEQLIEENFEKSNFSISKDDILMNEYFNIW